MYRSIETIIAYILKDTLCIRTQSDYHMTSSCEEKKRKKLEKKKVPARMG